MKQSWDNSYSAKERYLAAFGRFFLNIFNLGIYYGTISKFVGSDESEIEKQWVASAKEKAVTSGIKKFFEGNPLFDEEEYVKGMAAAFAKASTRLTRRALDTSTLIFAHTILDETLSECCRISFFASPADWFPFVEERKVKLGELNKVQSVRKEKTWEFVCELQHESIMRRFDMLHKICVPKLKKKLLPTAWISRDKLEAFDQLRHQAVHGKRFLREVPDIDEQIFFAKRSGMSILLLIWQAYPFARSEKNLPRNSTFLRLLVIARQEFPEFVEFFETAAEKLSNETHP